MRCFYVVKKWSSAKLSLNRGLSLNKMSLNRECTVLMYYLGTESIDDECINGRKHVGGFQLQGMR